LAWHAAGTYDKIKKDGGSDGGLQRFPPEASWGANAGLKYARDALEAVKAKFPGLSYADLYTLAGAVAIEEMGGPKIVWRPGRSDAPDGKGSPADGRLPDADKGQDHIRAIFYRMGFNDQEIVALVGGGHAIGRCHKDRSGYDGPWTRSPTTFSNEFFRLLLEEKWTERKWTGPKQFADKTGELMMLPADLALAADPEFKKYVQLYAKDRAQFDKDFAAAFAKLLELGVDFNSKRNWSAVSAPATAASAPAPKKEEKKVEKKVEEKSWWSKIFG
jgi:cytochrome c peroxidase